MANKKINAEWVPLNYQNLNLIEGTTTPSTIKVRNVQAYQYWERTLFQRIQSKIGFRGYPEEWTGFGVKDFFYFLLIARGYSGVRYIPKLGNVFSPCTVGSKLNYYYQPTKGIFANPNEVLPIRESELKIYDPADPTTHDPKTCCAIIKLTPDLRGAWDIISHYAEKLALMDGSTNSSILSAKIARIMASSSKAGAETLKSAVDRVDGGDIAVVVDKKVLDGLPKSGSATDPISVYEFFNANNYIIDKLLQDTATILNAFDTEIGINTVPYQKKERMVTSEAESKTEESQSRISLWIKTLNESLKSVNALFGYNIEAYIEEPERKEGGSNGENDDMGN